MVLAVAGVTAGLLLSACGTTGETAEAPASQAACDLVIAFLGPQTGDYANLGLNESRGAELALDKYNKENADCQVTFTKFDSQGDPEKATPLATQIVNTPKIVGVVGPAFSGETEATGPTFAEAGLVTVSPSATNPNLSKNGWDTFHRVLGNDDTQAPAAAKYIKETLSAKTVFVIDDASEYGKGLADGIKKDLGDLVKGTDTVQQKQTDFGASVTKVKAAKADVLYYAGYYAEAGLLAKQLKAGGWTGTFMSGDGSLDKGFVSAAGAAAANGAILTCPCAPAEESFATEYKALTGEDPGTYSTEAFDAMNVLLQGIKAGNGDRAKLLTWVNNYDAPGITKQIKFDETGEVIGGTVYAYKIEDGNLNNASPIE
ncbi:MAG: branched-chain amino acid ABC transporter substrate-binding protein [Microlunatus sp.]